MNCEKRIVSLPPIIRLVSRNYGILQARFCVTPLNIAFHLVSLSACQLFRFSAFDPNTIPLDEALEREQAPRSIPALQSHRRRGFDAPKHVLPLARNPLLERKRKTLLRALSHPLRD